MHLIAADDYDDLSRRAADIVVTQVIEKPASVLVVPTGNSPRGMFRCVIARVEAERIDVAQVRFVVLDEYAGLKQGDRRSLTTWLKRELLEPLGIGDHRLLQFDPLGDARQECVRMDAGIAAWGGLDLAILGLGPNGHLGMNEPGTPFEQRCAHVELTPETIRSNAVYWGSESDVPQTGFTLGLGSLRAAHKMVLLVTGAHKADILARVLASPETPELPASVLRRHASAWIIADRAARGEGGGSSQSLR